MNNTKTKKEEIQFIVNHPSFDNRQKVWKVLAQLDREVRIPYLARKCNLDIPATKKAIRENYNEGLIIKRKIQMGDGWNTSRMVTVVKYQDYDYYNGQS